MQTVLADRITVFIFVVVLDVYNWCKIYPIADSGQDRHEDASKERRNMYEGCSKSFEPLHEGVELGPSYSLRILSHVYDED